MFLRQFCNQTVYDIHFQKSTVQNRSHVNLAFQHRWNRELWNILHNREYSTFRYSWQVCICGIFFRKKHRTILILLYSENIFPGNICRKCCEMIQEMLLFRFRKIQYLNWFHHGIFILPRTLCNSLCCR